ncbi:hypothetical protein AVEN_25053-1 [Araneus ventricosus]|uniref:Uncharacterized protein n=1 Tax=Araneus ventricosus TaxID=182803 RepID=A0A4Y2I6Y7_ARAVE|nr:hypothetical protein AVEN_25053-1 [Araneus ventricosus]
MFNVSSSIQEIPDSTEDPPCMGPVGKFGEGVPAQVSSSSSDRDSKLRGPSQNSPRVASKRDVNITNLFHSRNLAVRRGTTLFCSIE